MQQGSIHLFVVKVYSTVNIRRKNKTKKNLFLSLCNTKVLRFQENSHWVNQ